MDLPDDLNAAPTRQVHVKQHHVRLRMQNDSDSAVGIGSFTDDGYRTADLCLDAGAKHRMIIDDDDPIRPPLGRCALRIVGIRGFGHLLSSSRTSVPSPGAERIVAEPPWRAMRSMMLPLTPRRSWATASTSKPLPRSRTNTSTDSSSTSA